MIRHRVSRLDAVGLRGTALAIVCVMFLSIAAPAVAQTPGWNTWWTDNTYYKPNYPIAFVVVPRVEYGNSHGGVTGAYNIGTDVLTANLPSAGAALYLYLPSDGTVVKLFPRAVHAAPPPNNLIDFDPAFGAVVEPSLSEDGTKIYFSYYQDARQIDHQTCNNTSGDCLLWTGADIYSIDISSWLTNTQTNPDNPAFVKRLTTRSYVGGAGSRKQDTADRDKDAMNIMSANAASASNEYGTSFLHPTEMRTKRGLSLVFVSDARRLEHSNFHMGRTNHNFNLFIADLLPDGSLGPAVNQFQYYTTTSALSPTPLREGVAFSYQGTTEDGRNWQIQSIDSLGRWNTLLGYGSNPELFHEATFCVGSVDGGPVKDYLVAAKYYNGNNQGFGSLWRQDLDPAVIGQNTYDNYENGYRVPYQVGSTPISQGATSQDGISLQVSPGVYYGKLTTPRCGGVNELYFTHTQTSANGRDYDPQWNKDIYKGYIGFRNSLAAWPVNIIGPGGHLKVIRSRNDIANLVWPLPIVPWSVRSNGDAQQRYSTGSIVTNHPTIKPGQPYAQLGSGSISNTDRRPYECPLNGHPFNQWGSGTGTGIGNENDRVVHNQAGWNILPAAGISAACSPPDPATILGIEVNITSNRKDLATDIQQFESKRVLGVYDARAQGLADTSFRTLIPANTPIELQLIDRTYGMKLTDVPSWHSLKPREMRVTCGGCHQHKWGETATPWDGSYASHNPPVDLVRDTPKLKYDAHCQPVMVAGSGVPAETVPEWTSDVWPGMVANCSSCHQNGQPAATSASLAALNWNGLADEASVYGQILHGMFASIARGALGSQLFWAARGKRTDNRDNTLLQYAAHYDCDASTDAQCITDAYRYGFHYSPAHNRFDQICNSASGDQGLSDWIFTLGKWIDNSVPRDLPGAWSSKDDRFHPTADVAISDVICSGSQMFVGWWDEGNALKSVKVSLLSGGTTTVLFLKQAVGSAWFPNSSDTDPPFAVAATLNDSDVVQVEVIDSSDNRQIYKKRVDQLRSECALPIEVDPEFHP